MQGLLIRKRFTLLIPVMVTHLLQLWYSLVVVALIVITQWVIQLLKHCHPVLLCLVKYKEFNWTLLVIHHVVTIWLMLVLTMVNYIHL